MMKRLPLTTVSTTVFTKVNLKTTRALLLALSVFIGLLTTVELSASSADSVRHLLFANHGDAAPTVATLSASFARQNLSVPFATTPIDCALNIPRRGHSATLLSNGKILIVGGENQSGFVTEAETYDPATRSFSVSGNLNFVRTDHTATLLADGRVLIAGGRGELGILNSTEIFEPGSGAFTTGPNMNNARAGHTATTLSDGRVVFTCGDDSGTIEVYDSSANAFTSLSATLARPRAFHGAVALNDDRILIVGGTADGNDVKSGEILSTANDNIAPIAGNTEDEHIRPLLRVLADGKVQIIGGSDHEVMEIYDPAANQFGAHAHVFPIGDSHPELLQQIMDAPTRTALFRLGSTNVITDRARHSITELPASKEALIAGGVDSNGRFLTTVSIVNSSTATITTDKVDYAPVTPVIVSGAGFEPNEVVTITFHEDPHVDTENPHTFTVQANANGNFSCQEYAPEDEDRGITYILAATGGNSGWTAQTAFTDSVPPTVSLTALGTSACENFNALASTGTSSTTPNGWTFSESGTSANTTYTAGTGSSTTGDTYSFGATSSSERAFGELTTGSLNSTIGASFTNNTGQTITSLAISYTGEQWRLGALNRTDRLDFQYSTDATSLANGTWTDVNALDFTAPVQGPTTGALDGNASANRTSINATITGLNIANAATFWIRWSSIDAASSDDGLAIDDFCLTPQGVPNVSVAVSPSAVAEDGATNLVYTFTRSNTSGGALTANFSVGGSATFGTDYTQTGANTFSSSAGTITFAAGQSTATVTIDPAVDSIVEPDETVILTVTTSAGYNVGSPSSATGTIENDDVQCSPPEIAGQPNSLTNVCVNSSAQFSVAATGTNLTYRWYKMASPAIPLSDGGNISGATTPTLTINPVGAGDVASYYVVVSGTCNPPATSNAVTLALDNTAPVPNANSLPDVNAQCSANLPTAPTATDSCDGSIVGMPNLTGPFAQGDYTIVWTFTDSQGNSSTQNQAVHVHDTIGPSPNATSLPDVNEQCSANLPTAPRATDNCDGLIIGTPNQTGPFAQGDYTIVWTFTDSQGNSSTQNQAVHVHDTTDPSFVIVESGGSASANNSCQAVIPDVVDGSKANDNCDNSVAITQSPLPGTLVGLGTHTITLTATDGAGNDTTMTTTFTVNDTTPPAISCPADILMYASSNSGATATYLTPIGADNCSGASTQQTNGLASGATFPLGTTTNTFEAIDGAGKKTSCSFTVTVNQAPTNTTVLSLLSPSAYGDSINFTATVSATQGGGTPSGTVQFKIDGAPFGSPVALSGGTATSGNVSTLTHGNHTVDAEYSGDAAFVASHGSMTQNVGERNATWATNSNSKLYGQADPNPLTTGSGSGFLSGDHVNATYSRDPGSNVGPYHLIATLIATPMSALDNYNTTNSGNIFMIQADPTLITLDNTASGTNCDCTNNTYTATLTDTVTGSGLAGVVLELTIGSQTTNATTNMNGVATFTMVLDQAPSPPTVTESVGLSGPWTDPNRVAPKTVSRQFTIFGNPDVGPGATAVTLYTGSRFFWTTSPTSSTATLTLSATIKDTLDLCPGDIRKAKASFFIGTSINGPWNAVSNGQNLPVGLVDPADTRTGTASVITQYNLGKDKSVSLWVKVTVGGEYIMTGDEFNVPVTVAIPGQVNTMIAGGTLMNDGITNIAGIGNGFFASGYLGVGNGVNSGGLLAGSVDFGGQVTYNKSLTNPQGQLQVMIHSYNKPDGTNDYPNIHSYYVKSNSISEITLKGQTASFGSKTNVYEIVGTTKNGLDGGGVMQFASTPAGGQITLTSSTGGNGQPKTFYCPLSAAEGCMSVIVYKSAGGVWFSSGWGTVGTVPQTVPKTAKPGSGSTVVQ